MKKVANSSLPTRIIFRLAFNIKKSYLKYIPKAHKTGKMPVIDKVFSQI